MAAGHRQNGHQSHTSPQAFAVVRSWTNTLIIFLLFVHFSWQQKDPLNDFCRRFGHQSAVIDRKLYLDGGLVNWNPISQNQANYTSKLAPLLSLTSRIRSTLWSQVAGHVKCKANSEAQTPFSCIMTLLLSAARESHLCMRTCPRMDQSQTSLGGRCGRITSTSGFIFSEVNTTKRQHRVTNYWRTT